MQIGQCNLMLCGRTEPVRGTCSGLKGRGHAISLPPLNAGTTGLPIRLLDDYVVVRTDQASTCASLTESKDRKLLLRGNILAPSQPNKNGEYRYQSSDTAQ